MLNVKTLFTANISDCGNMIHPYLMHPQPRERLPGIRALPRADGDKTLENLRLDRRVLMKGVTGRGWI